MVKRKARIVLHKHTQDFMSIKLLFYIGMYALFNVSGAAILKNTITNYHMETILDLFVYFSRYWVIFGLFLITLSLVMLIKAFSLEQFSFVFPIAIGVNFILTVIVGYSFFNETFSLYTYAGISLILVGIILMSI